jgi:hypothetical protein
MQFSICVMANIDEIDFFTHVTGCELWFDRIRGFLPTFGDVPLWNI